MEERVNAGEKEASAGNSANDNGKRRQGLGPHGLGGEGGDAGVQAGCVHVHTQPQDVAERERKGKGD